MDLGFAIRDVALIAAVGRTPTPRSELEQDYGRVFWLRRLLPLVAMEPRVHMEREMCELKHSFFDSEKMDFGLSISPAAMYPLGFKRFCDEVVRYPTETQRILRDDLSLVSDACMEKFGIEASMKDSNPLFTE